MVAEDSAAEFDCGTTLRRWWAFAGLMLFGATWKLWTPQSEFPQVPLFGWAGSLPLFVDWLAFGVLLGALATIAWRPSASRIWLAFACALSVLIMVDQHRLQPWAWQLLLMAAVFTTPPARLLRVLTVSIYFWSAVSKFDASFFASHGQTLVEALFQSVGLNAAAWPASVKWWLAFALPIGELLVAVGLCWPRTRRAALIAATALHVGLLLALGPTGLGHRPGVLLWNIAFIGHDWLLFGARTSDVSQVTRSVSEGVTPPNTFTPSLTLRVTLIGFACVWPITERWGLCDRWLAWSVYSTQNERVGVTLTDEGARRLPESARRFAVDGELWLDRWSLAALEVPIYPQLRFQLGVVEWLRQRCGEEHLVEVSVQHSERDGGLIERLTVAECDERRRSFGINTQPRSR
ncbi:MAG: hypothetical protein ACKV2Q_21890 [Planctomycetaceae bacterium]